MRGNDLELRPNRSGILSGKRRYKLMGLVALRDLDFIREGRVTLGRIEIASLGVFFR
jgi:hypothetical protein